MEQILPVFILLPLLAFIISLFLPAKKEMLISVLSIGTLSLQLLGSVLFALVWIFTGASILDIKQVQLFRAGNIEIFINFFYDGITASFAVVGSILAYLVAVFSRYYLHRDHGYKRYFNTILLFILGYNLVIFSGNFETLFIGWEILGICSFLLIAFYRDRYLPVKNSLKVISFYRIGDICLILAMWMSHQLWHENITFFKLSGLSGVSEFLSQHPWQSFFVAGMTTVAAMVKSAQFPFTSWLPRAMEGPTTSSAIFYGSLSVHLGVFLLLRTYPIWESLSGIKILIIIVGAATAVMASGTASVQSSVKTQIAYSSAAQIGLMFIEVALGLHWLALIHFAGNAFLRTYQLLVSPSVLSYLVHKQFFHFEPSSRQPRRGFVNQLSNSFFMLGTKEWNLDAFFYQYLWHPFKWLGSRFAFFSSRPATIAIAIIYLCSWYADIFRDDLPDLVLDNLALLVSILGLCMILKAFAARKNALEAWLFVSAGQFFIAQSAALLNDQFDIPHILLYLGGSLLCTAVGFLCLQKASAIDKDINLNRFHGYVYERPTLAFVFLVACLGVVGLPFTPSFIGMDVLFSHIHHHQVMFVTITALSFLFIELAILRIYARVFLGQHKKLSHPVAYRSS